MFSSPYFNPEYFNEYFKVTGDLFDDGGGNSRVRVNQRELKAFNLEQDDEDILEFVVAFVLSRRI